MSEGPGTIPDQSHGTLLSWEEGFGDDKKFHIAHVSALGLTFVRRLKDHAEFEQLVHDATNEPANAVSLLQSHPKAEVHPIEKIARATYAEQLNQLYLFDDQGKRTGIPEGKDNPQGKIFTALTELGGTQSEEDADAWSVLKTPLFVLSVIAVIGGFFIWFTTICEPDFEATGRRAGMKQLMNTIGYAVGPIWSSVVVGLLALPVISLASYLLIKRPVRQILSFR